MSKRSETVGGHLTAFYTQLPILHLRKRAVFPSHPLNIIIFQTMMMGPQKRLQLAVAINTAFDEATGGVSLVLLDLDCVIMEHQKNLMAFLCVYSR